MAEKNNYPLPNFLSAKQCVNCEKLLSIKDYVEIGFYFSGENKDKLFARYKCPKCSVKGNLIFGGENYNIEKLCIFILSTSKFLTEGEKLYIVEHFSKEKNKNDDF
jgi:Zn finger protein HypA/HybF involved in hydrogenase expression